MSGGGCGVVLDLDGVVHRGNAAIPGAMDAISRLESAGVPFICVTNSGGKTRGAKSAFLEAVVGLRVPPERIVMSHSPIAKRRDLASRRVLVVSQQPEVADEIMAELGFENYVSIQALATANPSMYPSKRYEHGEALGQEKTEDEVISAVLVLQAPTDWGEALQIICDVVRLRGRLSPSDVSCAMEGQGVEVLIANPDFSYAAEYPYPRMTSGAFRVCLEALFKHETGRDLEYTLYGKPHRVTYEFARQVLEQQEEIVHRIYAVGDNPKSDIRGANDMGWYSILTCTGCFKKTKDVRNDPRYPAKQVCESVLEAVEFILRKEGIYRRSISTSSCLVGT